LETGIQPMQASPCVQDLRHITLHPFALSRFADMLLSLSGFPFRLVGCLGGSCALDLLPLWGNLMCAETANHNFRHGIKGRGIVLFANL
jgi:hypothetical protein